MKPPEIKRLCRRKRRSLRLLPVLFLLLFALGAERSPAGRTPPKPLLVGYFPQWGVYDKYFVKDLVTSGGARLLDQMNYAQGVIADNRCAVADPNADLNLVFTSANSVNGKADSPDAPLRGNFHQLQELKRRFPKLKMIISLEGNAAGFAGAAKTENRSAFVASCINMFVRGHLSRGVNAGRLFDGFDIDWEVPTAAEKDDYLALLQEFRHQLDAVEPGLQLSIAVSAGYSHYQGFDIKGMTSVVDQFAVMNYDYSGPWSHQTGFLAPLYYVPGDPLHGTIETTMRGYLEEGVPSAKLLMGVPFYAYGWEGVPDVNHGLFQPGQVIRGDHFYRHILAIQSQYKLYRDENSKTPWLYDGKSFWTFDDPISVAAKLDYARGQKLGGVMVWELSNDSGDAVLLKTIAASLHRRPRGRLLSALAIRRSLH